MDCRPLDPSEINFLWGCLSAGGVLDFHRVQKMMQGCGFDPSVREINDLLWHIDGQNGSVKKFPFTKFINSKMTRESMWEFMWTRPRPPKDEVSAEMDEVLHEIQCTAKYYTGCSGNPSQFFLRIHKNPIFYKTHNFYLLEAIIQRVFVKAHKSVGI
eukprot:GEMP01126852.1.p1 GENE.GEMP01126852.1~~GEMP01126852.1.p1  ORF type:complete len:157 (+),score=9.07 GEMP01126852.1:86-556(+)